MGSSTHQQLPTMVSYPATHHGQLPMTEANTPPTGSILTPLSSFSYLLVRVCKIIESIRQLVRHTGQQLPSQRMGSWGRENSGELD